MPEGALAFAGALAQTGYMFTLVKATEVLVGALLLANRFVPLALALIAPVLVNIVLFHAVLAPSGIGAGLVFLALELYLAWSYRGRSVRCSRPGRPRERAEGGPSLETPRLALRRLRCGHPAIERRAWVGQGGVTI